MQTRLWVSFTITTGEGTKIIGKTCNRYAKMVFGHISTCVKENETCTSCEALFKTRGSIELYNKYYINNIIIITIILIIHIYRNNGNR